MLRLAARGLLRSTRPTAAAAAAVSHSAARRAAAFGGMGGGPTGGAGSSPAAAWESSYLKHFGSSHDDLNTWMATYYRQAAVPADTPEEAEMAAKVHGERIVGALFASLKVCVSGMVCRV